MRREMKITMSAFLFLSFAYIVGWGVMFDSDTFRWTYAQWSFFAVIITLGTALIIICFIVGIFCRMNFGRGLSHHRTSRRLSHILKESDKFILSSER